MKTLLRTSALAAGAATVLVACASSDSTATTQPATPRATPTSSDTPQQRSSRRGVVGTVVRFSRGRTAVDVTIRSDHPASRDFLARLPMRLTIEEFSGKEKISYLPRKLRTAGSPGSDPKNGDLIYFKPWGNLGFYYDASGIGYSDDTINLGSYRATRRQLARLEGGPVTVRALPRSRR